MIDFTTATSRVRGSGYAKDVLARSVCNRAKPKAARSTVMVDANRHERRSAAAWQRKRRTCMPQPV
eukprot:87976-Chlamydomonas_euryale.AAC.4